MSAAVEADGGESHADSDDDDGEAEVDLEKQIAKELASIKRPRKEQRFGMLHPTFVRMIRETRVEWLIT